MTIKHLYEDERPTLLLDFANSKTLDPRISFERQSVGTYVDELGIIRTAADNEARFDHDPETGECLGLLIEESRTNRCENSIPNTANGWSETGGTLTANAVTAPDGTTTAATLIEDTSTGVHRTILDSHVGDNGITYTSSVYVKAAGRTTLNLQDANAGQNIAVQFVDLAAGTITPQGGGPAVGFIEPAGNGWYRVGFTYTMITFNGSVGMIVDLTDSPGNNSYTGDGTSGIHVWGGQHEIGSFGTSYIPTSGATAPRAQDFVSITGTNFSSWWNSSEGSIVTVADNFPTTGNRKAWEFNDGNAVTPSGPTLVSGSFFQSPVNGDYTDSTINFGSIKTKTAFAFTTDGVIAGSGDGSTVQTATRGLDPDVALVRIGASRNGTVEALNGTIAIIHYYPTRLSDTALEALTK